ncbi:MAG: Asp-tRNA(Asn)/Glu-tRNA(Gln) amidotransferase GatCAB subunit A, partial [Candidatus Portnoybacteria bacterium CG10_big_fil_rev_8_21_14_0_10_44_7]
VEIKMPHFKYSLACYYLIMPSEISSNLARYDGIRFGLSRRRGQGVWDIFAASRQAGFGDEAKRRIVLGTYALSAGYYDAYYLQAQKARRLIAQDFKDAWSKVDIVLGPTTPSTAFKIGENTSDPLQMYLEDIYTVPVNLAGVPALSLPVGRDKKGLPIGAHLVANHFTENKLFALGKEIEKII